MELQYYIQYIIAWFYHNVMYTDATFAILKIVLIIGVVSLLVYRQYALFVVLCIVILILEGARWMKETNRDFGELQKLVAETVSGAGAAAGAAASGVVRKDDLTMGVSISSREGFSLGMPTIIRGDDSGKDHRRSNKFVEHDSNEFTDKYFKSKQCSIGSGIGGITMFGSNELIGTSRTATVNRIYDFEGKVIYIPNNDDGETNVVALRKIKRYEYFRDCVYDPVFRSSNNGKDSDFRAIKKDIFDNVNAYIINIERCLKRFNTVILFDTASDISADRSRSLTMAGMEASLKTPSPTEPTASVAYVSLINGEDGNEKMKNIIGLEKGDHADNANISEYSRLLQFTSEEYKTDIKKKELYLAVYGKVFRYRKRIEEILSMMFEQSKNDVSAMNTIRISEPVIKELRMILGYLAIIKCTKEIIDKEQSTGIYNGFNPTTMSSRQLSAFTTADAGWKAFFKDTDIDNNIQNNNILKLPHDDDTYNNTDEKRYLYGITYYFGGRPHSSPPPPPS
jgi:hypothetical protein